MNFKIPPTAVDACICSYAILQNAFRVHILASSVDLDLVFQKCIEQVAVIHIDKNDIFSQAQGENGRNFILQV